MKFQILDQIQRGKAHDEHGITSGTPRSMVPPLPHDLPAVRCDRVSSLYWEAEVESFDLQSNDFGIIKPPFPLLFFEWDLPRRVFSDGAWIDGEAMARAIGLSQTRGAVVHDVPNADGSGGLFECYGFLLLTSGRAVIAPMGSVIRYDEHGLFVSSEDGQFALVPMGDAPSVEMICAPALIDRIQTEPALRQGLMSMAGSAHQVVAMAISFMHCKGAGVEWSTSPPAVYRKAAAAGYKGPQSYGVVKVPALKSRTKASKAEVRESLGERMTAHWVRGHFKTYTADAPLFGARTGSFWWQPSVRGKKGEARHRQYDVEPTR